MTKNPAAYLTLSLTLLSIVACAQGAGSAAAAPPKLETEDQKTLYALGLIVGKNLKTFNLKPEELEIVQAGLKDSILNAKPQIELEAYGPKVNDLAQRRQTAGADDEKKRGDEYAAKAATEPGATKTTTGIVMKTLKAGDGKSPTADDTVSVHYEGKLIDGTVFDSSVKRGQPAEFPLKGVVPCWTEAVQKMKVHEKAQVVCPAAVAYGDRGSPPTIPPGATLIFEIELLDIVAKK
jgi:FKBP-type peptidyl-prolyl cis-trans isomerase FkpA